VRVTAFGPGVAPTALAVCGTVIVALNNQLGWVLIAVSMIGMTVLWVERLVVERQEYQREESTARLALYAKALGALVRGTPMDMGNGSVVIDESSWNEFMGAVEDLNRMGEPLVVPDVEVPPTLPEDMN